MKSSMSCLVTSSTHGFAGFHEWVDASAVGANALHLAPRSRLVKYLSDAWCGATYPA